VAFRARSLTASTSALAALILMGAVAGCGGSNPDEPARFLKEKSASDALNSGVGGALGITPAEVTKAVNESLVHMFAAVGVTDNDLCFAYDSLEPDLTAAVVISNPAGYPQLGLQELVIGIPEGGAPARLLPSRPSLGRPASIPCGIDVTRPHFYFKLIEDTYPPDVRDAAASYLSDAAATLNATDSAIDQLYSVAQDAREPALCTARVADAPVEHVDVLVSAGGEAAKVNIIGGRVGEVMAIDDDELAPGAGTYFVARSCTIENGRLIVDAANPTPPATNSFRTASGNIICKTDADGRGFLACTIKSGIVPSLGTKGCQPPLGWYDVYLGEKVYPSCTKPPRRTDGEGLTILPNGSIWEWGRYRCTATDERIRCESDTAHGFELSRKESRFF
jgi:hypothetical protein